MTTFDGWISAAATGMLVAAVGYNGKVLFVPPQPTPAEPPNFGRVSKFVITTHDKVAISGSVIRPSDDRGRGVVILCHGWRLTKERFLNQARWLVDRGFIVVNFDFRNCGESARVRRVFPEPLHHGVFDLDAVFKFAAKAVPEAVRGISVIGFSYGGNVALAHAGSATPRYRSLVLDSTPMVTHRNFLLSCVERARASGEIGTVRWLFAKGRAILTTWLLKGGLFYRMAIRSCAQLQETPMLYIVGEKENFFSVEEARQFADDHYRGPVTILKAAKGRHLTNHISDQTRYWEAIERLLTQAHRPAAPAPAPASARQLQADNLCGR